VREAAGAAGAGRFEGYDRCAFRTSGRDTFRAGEDAQPAVGEAGKTEEVEEWRLEMTLPSRVENAVVSAVLAAHPYEEPAYDLYALRSSPLPCGAGLTVRLEDGRPAELVRKVADAGGPEGALKESL